VNEAHVIQKSVEKCLKDRFGPDTYVIIKIEPFLDCHEEREKHIMERL